MAARTEQRLRSEAHFADFKPVFSSLVEDSEGNLWVEHFRWIPPDHQAPDPQPTRWSVFDTQGVFLGEVQVPAGFIISTITSDQVLGVWQDDLDVEHVRVYGLIKPGSVRQ